MNNEPAGVCLRPNREHIPAGVARPNWELLAGVRFALALVVACAHWHDYYSVKSFDLWSISIVAVAMFLMVSGFSMAHSVSVQPNGFFRRRFLRLYPTYILCLGLAVVPYAIYGPVIHHHVAGTSDWVPLSHVWTWFTTVLMLSGASGEQLSSHGVAWSLSIEIAFYLFAPALAVLTSRPEGKIAIWAAIGISLAFWNRQNDGTLFAWPSNVYLAFFGLGWIWLCGFHLYHIRHSASRAAMLVVSGYMACAPTNSTIAAAIWGLCGLGFLSTVHLPPPTKTTMQFLGDISYPLYLCHVPVFLLILPFGLPMWTACLCAIAAAIAVHIGHHPLRHHLSSALCECRRVTMDVVPTTVVAKIGDLL